MAPKHPTPTRTSHPSATRTRSSSFSAKNARSPSKSDVAATKSKASDAAGPVPIRNAKAVTTQKVQPSPVVAVGDARSGRKGKRKMSVSRPADEDEVGELDGLSNLDLEVEEDEIVGADGGESEEEGEEESFPEIYVGDSGEEEDEDEDEGDQDGDTDEELLAELEREDRDALTGSEDEDERSFSASDLEDASDREAAMETFLRRARQPRSTTGKLASSTPGTSPDDAPTNLFKTPLDQPLPVEEATRLLGFDPRPYNDRAKVVRSRITGEEKKVWDEIDVDIDDDEEGAGPVNRVGNIPAHFYDDMPHIGYNIDGKKVLRPAKGDELDKFLAGLEKEEGGWTSIDDPSQGKTVDLTSDELDLIHRLAKSENPDESYDPYEPTIEWFTGKGREMVTPLSGKPIPKGRFIPSKWEHKKIMKVVRAIRQGRIVTHRSTTDVALAEAAAPRFYNIWSDADTPHAPHAMHMPAPKLKLPTHAESYNPPAEYIPTPEEAKEWNETDPTERKVDYLPKKHDALRKVGAFHDFVKQRFDRCLDLYLAPRMLRRRPRLDITDPEQLLPKLPSPKDLRPFPTTWSVLFPHPNGIRTRCISIDPTGMWVVTGAEDGLVRLWECRVGRCAATWKVGGGEAGPVLSVEWNPDRDRPLFAVTVAGKASIISPVAFLAPPLATSTEEYATSAFKAPGPSAPTISSIPEVRWSVPSDEARKSGVLVEISVVGSPKQVTWHRRGDYFATVASDAGNRGVLIHQLTKHQTQSPFRRTKGSVERVAFHPGKPHLFVATQRYVRVYDLMAQHLIKTLQPGLRWISSMDVHPLGDNLILGSYDKRLVWHDLDLSERPYKTLRYHARALRSVSFHPRYPLFLTTSDDGTIHVFHATVYSDLLTNPLIVPLKVLKGHQIKDGLGVLDARWHPREPWIVSVGADGVGRLWT